MRPGSEPDFLWQEQMGYTRKELVRGLPRAVSPYRILDVAANPVEMVYQHCAVKMHLGEDGWRMLGSMRISCLSVRLEFFRFHAEQYEAFLHRFRTYLHRGGG